MFYLRVTTKECKYASDKISVPINVGNQMMREDTFCVKLSYHGNSVYAKATEYDAPFANAIIPTSLCDRLSVGDGDIINVSIIKSNKITEMKISSPKIVENPLSILNYLLKDKQIISTGEIVRVKIFDKIYEFVILNLKTSDGDAEMGLLYGSDLVADVAIDIEYT